MSKNLLDRISVTLAIACGSVFFHAGNSNADFGAALKAYEAGDKRALTNDLAAVIQARSIDQLDRWWTAMTMLHIGAPPSIRGVATTDTQEH